VCGLEGVVGGWVNCKGGDEGRKWSEESLRLIEGGQIWNCGPRIFPVINSNYSSRTIPFMQKDARILRIRISGKKRLR
jgi:hypothetical protein